MDYKQCYMEEQYGQMERKGTIQGFLTRFAQSLTKLGGEAKQRTVILFPGGMGSELARAYQQFNGTAGSYAYETVWYDVLGVLFAEHTLQLDMYADFDRDQRMVVADGAIENCVYSPYDNFKLWCTDNDLDLLVVGWDFRRHPDWVVEFFLDHLTPKVTERAANAGLPDPFARATIIGHSFGGMVAKWILNKHDDPFCQKLALAVTVGSPFYGSAGHPHRYFVGEPLAGLTTQRAELAKVIATFKGGFSLMFLDEATYARFQPQLSTDSSDPRQPGPYPLAGYPSVDQYDQTAVDPFNPLAGSAGWFRYPDLWNWFAGYLSDGRDQYRLVAEPLDASVEKKLHCIRGVQFEGGAPKPGTAVSQRWHWVPRDPRGDSAVWEQEPDAAGWHDFGPGDDTIPAWSARLVTQPPENIHTIEGDLSHMSLLDDGSVRSTLLGLIQGIQPPDPDQQVVAGELRFDPASREEFYQVRNELERIASEGPKAQARRRAQAYIAGLGFARQQALMKRGYMEVLRGPIRPLDRPPERERPSMPARAR
jgi:pimeloyl-ACP methyl ester carboxylesterase